MPSLESRLTACIAAVVGGVAVAALGLWQVPRPDTWFLLAVASVMILLGTVGILFFERAPQVSLWAALGTIGVLAVTVIPLIWVVVLAAGGDQTPATLFGGDLSGFASPLDDERFADLAANSAAAAGAATLLGLLIGGAVAYPLARGRMRGRRAARLFVWASLFIPVVALVGPWSVRLIDAGLLDTPFALVSSFLILTVPICAAGLLFVGDRVDARGFALAESEGATRWQRFRRVTVPTVGPGVLGVAALAFLAVWNDLLVSATVTVWQTETVGVWARSLADPSGQAGLLVVWLVPALAALFLVVRAADSILVQERSS